jgi:hypothetical protein
MTADATAGRYEFGTRVDDPRQALDQLADTIPLVDDITHLLAGFHPPWLSDDDIERWDVMSQTLSDLRRRLEAIHARLTS